MENQNAEQKARDLIDQMLRQSGWIVQSKKTLNLKAGSGVAVREYQTDIGPADYVLFVDMKAVGIIEAKREESGQNISEVEEQARGYALAKLKFIQSDPLPFVYESTGAITRFTDYRDPKPRARVVFSFHRPETLQNWSKQAATLRARIKQLPALPIEGLRDCQVIAINNLEASLKDAKPKALIQMATGSGKTFTAITSIYRLLKYAKASRVLFLVDTKNLGEQAESEFRQFQAKDDNRLFTELYGVTRLQSSYIPSDSQVYISTIQRMYSILKGVELDESAEEENPNETRLEKREPMPVTYTEKVPLEFFDFIVIDECHRSIYNLWKQVLDYFDAFQIGLTATPDNRTFGYFEENLVSDYGYEKAVIDGVLVPYNVFSITTKITKEGAKIEMGEAIDKRERLTRKRFWETLDEDLEYRGKQLDNDIVNLSTIRTIIRATKDTLPSMFPDRIGSDGNFEVPKMLIFAKTDSHAEDIIEIVRTEWGEANQFCKKITYRSEEDPKSVLTQFRNDYYPRIAVTVDMIATGTDIRPLEVLLFMRDVKSKSYYEQMKGRGTRTCSLDELRKKGTPSARFSKDHFVIIDAIGVEQSQKTDSRPLEKAPGLSLKDVLTNIALGNASEEMTSTLANRLIRLEKLLTPKEKSRFTELAEGRSIAQVVGQLLQAYDPDRLEEIKQAAEAKNPGGAPLELEAEIKQMHERIIAQAVDCFHNPSLREYLIDVRRQYDQVLDNVNMDTVQSIGWVKDQQTVAEALVQDFTTWIEENKDTIQALKFFYGQPYQRRALTFRMIKELSEALKTAKPNLAPLRVWQAYTQLEQVKNSPKNELIALVSLVRRVCEIDQQLTPFDATVQRNFQTWVFQKQAGALKYTEEQMQWLHMVKDCVSNSFHIEKDDFDLDPFNKSGGLGRFYQLFGADYEQVLEELNEGLTA
jgi:type I restriction enzyme, R subunit